MNRDNANINGNELLSKLKAHVAAMPEKKASLELPRCHCMKICSPLVKNGLLKASRICLCCSSLTSRRKSKRTQCLFD